MWLQASHNHTISSNYFADIEIKFCPKRANKRFCFEDFHVDLLICSHLFFMRFVHGDTFGFAADDYDVPAALLLLLPPPECWAFVVRCQSPVEH